MWIANRAGCALVGLCVILTVALTGVAGAIATVEVAPGLQVSRKTFDAPADELPFYGFADKSGYAKSFAGALADAGMTPQKAFAEFTGRGWRAVGTGKFAEAGRWFNRAYLLAPERSEVYHGLAIVVTSRFQDMAFADELFRAARGQVAPLRSLSADYGRFLLIARRPRDAEPVLEQAVKDQPEFATAWSNLASARFENGNSGGACLALDEARKRGSAADVADDIAVIARQAGCSIAPR